MWHDENLYTSCKIWDYEGGDHVDYRVVTRDTVQSGIDLPNLTASHPRIQPQSIQLIHLQQYIQCAAQVFGTCADNDPAKNREKN